jgi:carbon monoxide dehydrogenase subunit G
MVITTRFELSAPIEVAWGYLLDVQKVANCVPGASLTQVVDERTYDGKIEIKLGPISVAYKGRVSLQNIDEANHRVEIRAQGTESRGRGGASATSTAELAPGPKGTSVLMSTDVSVSGVVAQFGRSGIMQDVAQRLTERFGSCVEQQLKAGTTAG